jgi:hypothetical protein
MVDLQLSTFATQSANSGLTHCNMIGEALNLFVPASSDLHPHQCLVGIRTILYDFLIANSHR